MPSYLNRFHAMVKELQGFEYIELVEFTPHPAATEAQLKAFETTLKAPLDAAMRAFYSETNGLRLHWQIKPTLSAQEADRLMEKSQDYAVRIAEYEGDPFAMINILPIQALASHASKAVRIESEGETVKLGTQSYSTEQLSKRMIPFDVFSEENCQAFLGLPGNEAARVVLLGEGGSAWFESRTSSFASYLELLIATRGITQARLALYEDAGPDAEPVVEGDADYWAKTFTPDLFK